MPFIDSNGRVVEKQPWNVQRFVGLFWGLVTFVTMFFRNLFGENVNKMGSGYSRDYRGGGGPPGPPKNNRISGFSTPKSAPGGGCAGGNCGR